MRYSTIRVTYYPDLDQYEYHWIGVSPYTLASFDVVHYLRGSSDLLCTSERLTIGQFTLTTIAIDRVQELYVLRLIAVTKE